MADTYVRFVKWASILAGIMFGGILLLALTAGGASEFLWLIILYPIIFSPYYLGSLIPVFLYAFNDKRKSTFIYFLIIICCILGMVAAVLQDPANTPEIVTTLISPFFIILIRTLYHWYLGY